MMDSFIYILSLTFFVIGVYGLIYLRRIDENLEKIKELLAAKKENTTP